MVLLLFFAACTPARIPEDPTSWFDAGAGLEVTESVAFTDEPYDFPADGESGISALFDTVFPTTDDTIVYADGDEYSSGSDCESAVDNDLPIEIEGIVTVHPKFYFKTSGCGDGDEKYYGSFFLEDADAGIFVLGDTKLDHFDVGNRVRLRVRGARTSFDLDEVYSWDVVSIDRDVEAVYYETALGPLDFEDLYRVRRVTGTVTTPKDTFGLFGVEADDGTAYAVQLDIELNRRGVDYPVGERISVTGPVLYSYSLFSIVVMNIGQVTELDL